MILQKYTQLAKLYASEKTIGIHLLNGEIFNE